MLNTAPDAAGKNTVRKWSSSCIKRKRERRTCYKVGKYPLGFEVHWSIN